MIFASKLLWATSFKAPKIRPEMLETHPLHLKALIDGSKKFVHQDKVKYLSVPQYEGLGIKAMLAEA